jgi:hypothetical protein
MNEHVPHDHSRAREARRPLEGEHFAAHDHTHQHYQAEVDADEGLGDDGPLSRPSSGNFLDAGFEDFKEQPAREVEVDADLARAWQRLDKTMGDFGILPQH